MLPNFLVIGAAKAGTTSLSHYLRAHPQIYVPPLKELEFFVVDRNWRRGVDWYEDQFAAGAHALAIGEVSPSYTFAPLYSGVPERIAALLPEVRIVYLVRDPVARMRSHYEHRVIAGIERRTVADAIRDERYVAPSRYASQLDPYLELFPRTRILVITSENLRNDTRRTLAAVYAFLGADPDWWSPELEVAHNVTAGKRVWRGNLKRLRKHRVIRPIADATPKSVTAVIERVTHHEPKVDSLVAPELDRELRELFRDDVRRLRSLVQGEFDGWGIDQG